MKLKFLSYPIAIIILITLYSFSIPQNGFRLPFYYTPDGSIIHIGKTFHAPRGNKLIHINGEIPGNVSNYYSKQEKISIATNAGTEDLQLIPNHFWDIFFDFAYVIIASILFFLCSLWLYDNTHDIHLINVTLILSAFYLLFIISVLSNHLFFTWQIACLLLAPALLNMALRTTGRYVSNYLIMGEVNFVLFLSLLLYIGRDNIKTITNLNFILTIIYVSVIFILLVLQLIRALKRTKDSIENFKRWSLFLGSLLGLFVPLLLTILYFTSLVSYSIFPYFILATLIFPAGLIYGTYRLQLTPFQVIFSKSVVAFLQGAFFAAIYGLVVLIQNALLTRQQKEHEWIIQVIFILTLIFFLDPLRYALSSRLGKGRFWTDPKLDNSLQKMVSVITSHRRIQKAVETLLEEIQSVLEIDKIDILFSEDAFVDLHLKKNTVRRLPPDSHFWRYLQEYEFVVTDYLTYGSGIREELFHFLFKNNYMVAIGIKGKTSGLASLWRKKEQNNDDNAIKAALLIGYKKQNTILKINETRYLSEAARLVNVLIRNYMILISEIEKRQRIRELQIAGQVQRSLPEIEKEKCDGLTFAYSNQPALSVSGDYFDIVPLDRDRVACFLGDVCGHGLGTGYLVSSLRSIIHSHLSGGAKLSITIGIVNQFFMERYKGNEFLTLIGIIINTKRKEIEYINSAHPSPWLFKAKKKELIELKSFQPMIGILPISSQAKKIKIAVGDRLFLYSDGVTETFNHHNVPFTEKRLKTFLFESSTLPIQGVITSLEKQLNEFRGGTRLEDDTTMALLEIEERQGFFSKVIERIQLSTSFLSNSPTQLLKK